MLHCVEVILSLLNVIRGCFERSSGCSKGNLMRRCLRASGYVRLSCVEGVVKDLMRSYCSLLCHTRRWAVAHHHIMIAWLSRSMTVNHVELVPYLIDQVTILSHVHPCMHQLAL